MTMDGGLERLVRILHDFCMCPPPPENPNFIYGLSPPNARPQKLLPTLNPPNFDKHAAYRFSLAFQCVVNIGVRGSERIRSRVVQAGTLDVVGCILEAWLANKGFAVGPSSSASGIPRETREQRMARRQALAEQRQREGVPAAAELTRALQRQIVAEDLVRQGRGADTSIDEDPSITGITVDHGSDTELQANASSESLLSSMPPADRPLYARRASSRRTVTDTSDTSTTFTAVSQTDTTIARVRGRSGTIVARAVWEEPSGTATNAALRPRQNRNRTAVTTSPDESTDNSRPETETEDDGDVDVDMDQSHDTDDAASATHIPVPRTHRAIARTVTQRPRRAVGIISEEPAAAPLEVNTDAHIIINHGQGTVVDGESVGVVGVEDGIVSLEPNDDFAMGAPPGAPGAMDETRNLPEVEPTALERRTRNADATPRATVMPLPQSTVGTDAIPNGSVRPGVLAHGRGETNLNAPIPTSVGRSPSHTHNHRDTDSGPYKDEDVLLSLQLLAYLSKYPHVRQAFYKQRISFHPATAATGSARVAQQVMAGPSSARNADSHPSKEGNGLFRALASATARGKEKEKIFAVGNNPSSTTGSRMTNVFSLVERFTFRPSSSESDLPNPPPKLPPEIQYWAGVIMRNACRKDDSRGGIRQCANMLCGKWETYPREFAKCRRCRKAKYCGKECQSTAWSEGHRFWCSAKEGEENEEAIPPEQSQNRGLRGDGSAGDGMVSVRSERERTRPERAARERNVVLYPPGPTVPLHPSAVAAAAQGTRQRVSALPPTAGPPSPNTYAQMQRRRRAETVSGATTVVGMTQNGRPVYRHEVSWLADGRSRDMDEGGNNTGTPQRHARMDNMIWEASAQGDSDMVLG
ncbi:hypothetical protein PISMIDRAFT_362016 [Pisolithus microcarpus 441]|uniref:MYND-type domain-containing protein n=1 Tax=Pisolithus microcarpus 441 TaxID=765257 RepID=A0A0C9YJF1_9AGAM|nr:hypothetical protein PISMIDRAFT_362016 [Pisolithus microcarpus 441]